MFLLALRITGHQALKYDYSGAIGTRTEIERLALLFKTLDESMIEEEHARLEG